MTYALTDKSPAAIQARYDAACLAIGREDPSLAITDSHADIPALLTSHAALVAALEEAICIMTGAGSWHTVRFENERRECVERARAVLAKAGA